MSAQAVKLRASRPGVGHAFNQVIPPRTEECQRGKPPKLSAKQDAHLVALYRAGGPLWVSSKSCSP